MKTFLSCCACFLVFFSGCITKESQPYNHKKSIISNSPLPFKDYDAALISTIQNRWHQLLEDKNSPSTKMGKVVISFLLHSDGRVSELKVTENSVGELFGILCSSAILDSAPFKEWPSGSQLVFGKDFREVTFSFYND